LGVRALSASADLTDALVHRRGCGPVADINRERRLPRAEVVTIERSWDHQGGSCHQRRSWRCVAIDQWLLSASAVTETMRRWKLILSIQGSVRSCS